MPGVSSAGSDDVRRDPHLGTVVHVVGSRQARPNLPATGCPFCVGGLEAPEPYEVRWFPNRWPAMPGKRCEVVLYTPEHDATLWSLGTAGVRAVVDVWAARTEALGARDDVDFVLAFENRGSAVGATIDHPHGQIYAYDHVPDRPARLFAAGWIPDPAPGDRHVATIGGWTASVPFAPTYPVAVTLAPTERVPDLASLSDAGRDDLAGLLVDVLARLDRLYAQPLPYMLWVLQRPTTADAADRFADAWMQIEIVSPWRSAGVSRFIAAAEVSCEEYFDPVVPEDLAARLRALV
ncbi:MAG: galT [Ilumatobacteraceae bacterium]|nr:galT [Ilumatobacteraceae bacterium]